MNPRNIVFLCLFGIIVAGGCAQQKKTLGYKFYMFGEDPANRMDSPVLKERETHTQVSFSSEPQGASVYAFNNDTGKRDLFLGKTPCRYDVITWEITEFADKSAEYNLDIPVPYRVTKPVDLSDPGNDYGEYSFSFLFQLKGQPDRLKTLNVEVTNLILVKALALNKVPGYEVGVEW